MVVILRMKVQETIIIPFLHHCLHRHLRGCRGAIAGRVQLASCHRRAAMEHNRQSHLQYLVDIVGVVLM